MGDRLVIVGGDAAGMSAAATARRRDPAIDIVAFERGPYTSYSACGIPYYLSRVVEDVDRLVARTPAQFAEAGIEARVGHEVTAIDLGAGRLTVRDLDANAERHEPFDQLVYAAGAEAVLPDVPGAEACAPVRTLAEAQRYRAALDAHPGENAVVIGSGYVGLEMAEALVERGLEVVLLDQADQVMGSLDADMAAHVQEAAEGIGIRLALSTTLEGIEQGADHRPRGVRTSVGTLPADHVVMATGVRPAVGLAAEAGLAVGETGALRTDDHQRSPGWDGVFAAGDCAESHHRLLERAVNIQLGTHANKQGRVAGANATGGDAAFPGVIGTAASKVCRWEVARTGLSEREAHGAGRAVVATTIESTTRAAYFPGAGPIWIKLVVEPGTGRLLGGQIVGVENAAKRIDVLAVAVWNGMTAKELEWTDLSYAPPFSGVYDPVLVAARQAAKARGASASPS